MLYYWGGGGAGNTIFYVCKIDTFVVRSVPARVSPTTITSIFSQSTIYCQHLKCYVDCREKKRFNLLTSIAVMLLGLRCNPGFFSPPTTCFFLKFHLYYLWFSVLWVAEGRDANRKLLSHPYLHQTVYARQLYFQWKVLIVLLSFLQYIFTEQLSMPLDVKIMEKTKQEAEINVTLK